MKPLLALGLALLLAAPLVAQNDGKPKPAKPKAKRQTPVAAEPEVLAPLRHRIQSVEQSDGNMGWSSPLWSLVKR